MSPRFEQRGSSAQRRPFKQVRPSQWPVSENKPIGVLRLEPRDIRDRFGIEFSREVDDLDEAQMAVVEVENGWRFGLMRYKHNPSPGTEILAEADTSPHEGREAFLRALGLSPSDLTWVPDAIREP